MKRPALALLFSLALISTALAADKKPMEKKIAAAMPDKAYLQKIWDGWGTLDTGNVAHGRAYAPRPVASFELLLA